MIATAVSHYPKLGDGPGQQRLRQAIGRVDRGEAPASEIDEAARAMTVAAIQDQETAGLDLVTDGQIRWQDPITYLAGGLQGLETGGLLRWFESNTYFRQPRADAGVDVSWKAPILLEDLKFAKEHASRAVKAVLTGPYTIGTLSDWADRGHHRLVLDLARALNQELKSLSADGPEWIQVDEPAIVNNPSVRYPRDFGLFREAMAALTDGIDAPLSLYTYHGGAADVPGLLELPFQLFGFDFVQGSDNWRLLQEWPRGKGLGLGIVDARNVRMEEVSSLSEQVNRAAAVVGERSLHVSPSCGLEFLPRDTARRKLELVARATHAQGVTV
ncbi:MAG: methylcobamide--CoM methyltransferase [Candidatus Dormibacteraeota bacterium]|nr:methylcobamide--CoM methyltransferase [Candidatus Dormibacteraeota bacterium]